MKRTTLLVLGLLALPANAADIDQIDQLLQAEFRRLSEDIGAAVSYKAIAPAEPLGIAGFDLGVEVTATQLQSIEAWRKATGDDDLSETVYIPKLHLHVGLPLGFDLGAFYSTVAGTNVDFWGAEVRYAILAGSTVSPALGVRATYSKVSGVDQLDFNTRGLELTISKGFAFFTPYAGAGKVWVESTPQGVAALEAEDFSLNKYYVGANFNLAVLNLAIEGDRTGDATSYGLKLGWRF